jgi:hypothetical protein
VHLWPAGLLLLVSCSLPGIDVARLDDVGGAAGATSTGQSSNDGAASSSGASNAGGGGSNAGSGGSGGATASTSVSASGTGGTTSSSTASSGGSSPPGSLFFDDFQRPNNSDLGRGWVEKNPNAFELLNGRAVKSTTTSSHSDNLCYRKTLYDDVWVTADFVLSAGGGAPRVYARLDPAVIQVAGVSDGYGLYITSANGYLLLVRNTAPQHVFPQTVEFVMVSQGFVPGVSYRLQLRVKGTTPVLLEGHVSRLTGGKWVLQASLSYEDTDPTRFQAAGYVGFSEATAGGTTFDDFRVESAM